MNNFLTYDDAYTLFEKIGTVLPQKATLPTASADWVGKIVQYIGATTASYTKGYFYKCEPGETVGTYEWVPVAVQSDENGGSGAQSDWNQTDSTADDYIKNKPTIPDITGKVDKVTGATSGNFAGLDSNGNLIDSGKKTSDFATSGHTHSNATTSKSGFMSYSDKTKLNGLANIKSIGSGLSLDSSGVLSSLGGGSSTENLQVVHAINAGGYYYAALDVTPTTKIRYIQLKPDYANIAGRTADEDASYHSYLISSHLGLHITSKNMFVPNRLHIGDNLIYSSNGITAEFTSSDGIHIYGTNTSTTSSGIDIRIGHYYPVNYLMRPNADVQFRVNSLSGTYGTAKIKLSTSSSTLRALSTFTLPSNKAYCYISIHLDKGASCNFTFYPSIEFTDESDHTFEKPLLHSTTAIKIDDRLITNEKGASLNNWYEIAIKHIGKNYICVGCDSVGSNPTTNYPAIDFDIYYTNDYTEEIRNAEIQKDIEDGVVNIEYGRVYSGIGTVSGTANPYTLVAAPVDHYLMFGLKPKGVWLAVASDTTVDDAGKFLSYHRRDLLPFSDESREGGTYLFKHRYWSYNGFLAMIGSNIGFAYPNTLYPANLALGDINWKILNFATTGNVTYKILFDYTGVNDAD